MQRLARHWTCPWLVGGPMDGQHYPLPDDQERVIVPVETIPPLPRAFAEPHTLRAPEDRLLERAEYKRRNYTMAAATLTIWVSSDVKPGEADERVMALILRAIGAHPTR